MWGGMQRGAISRMQKSSFLPILKKEYLLFTSGKGDEAKSPSFATANAPIYAPSESPKALIASLLGTGGI